MARRMADVAAHLVDRVLPVAPCRQWTLSLPHDIRLLVMRNPDLLSRVVQLFLRAVFAYQRRRARLDGIKDPMPGAVAKAGALASPRAPSSLGPEVAVPPARRLGPTQAPQAFLHRADQHLLRSCRVPTTPGHRRAKTDAEYDALPWHLRRQRKAPHRPPDPDAASTPGAGNHTRLVFPEDGEKLERTALTNLEHLYRGRLQGARLAGRLLVKEPELPDYENLRSFGGKVTPAGGLVLDGMPLRRAGAGASAQSASVLAGWSTPQLPGRIVEASLHGRRRVKLEIAALIRGADRRMGQRRWREALGLLHRAHRLSGQHQARLLRRLGRCNLMSGRRAAARSYLGQALRLDPNNASLRQAYLTTR